MLLILPTTDALAVKDSSLWRLIARLQRRIRKHGILLIIQSFFKSNFDFFFLLIFQERRKACFVWEETKALGFFFSGAEGL